MATDFVKQVKRLMSCGYSAGNAAEICRNYLKEKGAAALEEYIRLSEKLYSDMYLEDWK